MPTLVFKTFIKGAVSNQWKKLWGKLTPRNFGRLAVWKDRVFYLSVREKPRKSEKNALRAIQTRHNDAPPRVPGEESYNSKDVADDNPAIAACNRTVELAPQLAVLDPTEAVGKTSSKPQHSRPAGRKLSLRHIFLTLSPWNQMEVGSESTAVASLQGEQSRRTENTTFQNTLEKIT